MERDTFALQPALVRSTISTSILCVENSQTYQLEVSSPHLSPLFLDAGTLLANTLAAGAALKLPIRVVAGFADAAVNPLLDLDPIIERFGNRGYRAAQLEAAIIGGKVYLAAYGQRASRFLMMM